MFSGTEKSDKHGKKYVALTYSLSLYNGSFYGKDLKTCIAQMQKTCFLYIVVIQYNKTSLFFKQAEY